MIIPYAIFPDFVFQKKADRYFFADFDEALINRRRYFLGLLWEIWHSYGSKKIIFSDFTEDTTVKPFEVQVSYRGLLTLEQYLDRFRYQDTDIQYFLLAASRISLEDDAGVCCVYGHRSAEAFVMALSSKASRIVDQYIELTRLDANALLITNAVEYLKRLDHVWSNGMPREFEEKVLANYL